MTKMNEDSINYSALDRDIKSRLSDFVKNPELVKDLLPQPYRRIDKIIQEIINNTWDSIAKKEKEIKFEYSKPRPPKRSNISIVKDFSVQALGVIQENNKSLFPTILIVSNDLLHAIDTNKYNVIDKISLNQLTITPTFMKIDLIYTIKLKENVHLVILLTEKGQLLMNLFALSKFYNIQQLTETEFSERKYVYKQIEFSKEGEYLAILQECNYKY